MYNKVKPGEPMYDLIEAHKKLGREICDSRDHNSNKGCSNPQCWKYNKKIKLKDHTCHS